MHNPGILQRKPFPLLQRKLLPLQIRPKPRFPLSLCVPSRSALQNLVCPPFSHRLGPQCRHRGPGGRGGQRGRAPFVDTLPSRGQAEETQPPTVRDPEPRPRSPWPHILGSSTPSTGSASAELVPPQMARQAHAWHLTPVCSLPGGLRGLGRGPGNSRGPASLKLTPCLGRG